jgi:hypothetical protein
MTIADPVFHFGIRYEGGWTKDIGLDLAFTDDLRITSTGATSKGRVGDAVKGTLKFVVSTLATVAGIVRGPGFGAAGRAARAVTATTTAKAAEEVYAETHPDAQALRNDTAKAIVAVRGALITNDTDLSTLVGSKAIRDATARSRALSDALARLEVQHAAAEARFDAWKASKRSVETSEFTYVVPVKDLPSTAQIEQHLVDPSDEQLGACSQMYDDLHTVVAVTEISGRKDPSDIDPTVGDQFQGVFFRKPRVVELSIYERTHDDAGKDVLVLTRRSRHLVVDDNCERRFVKFDKSAWGDRAVALSFGDLGELDKISSTSTSTAAAIGATLGELPAVVKDALEQGNAAVEQLDKIRNVGVSREIARLDKEAELLKKRVAADLDGADGTALRQLEELKRKKELLTAQKDVGDAAKALEPAAPSSPAAAPTTGRKVVITIDGDSAE